MFGFGLGSHPPKLISGLFNVACEDLFLAGRLVRVFSPTTCNHSHPRIPWLPQLTFPHQSHTPLSVVSTPLTTMVHFSPQFNLFLLGIVKFIFKDSYTGHISSSPKGFVEWMLYLLFKLVFCFTSTWFLSANSVRQCDRCSHVTENQIPSDPYSSSDPHPFLSSSSNHDRPQIVVISHGYMAAGCLFSIIAGVLASHGYLVLAPDHTDGSAVAALQPTAHECKLSPNQLENLTHVPLIFAAQHSPALFSHHNNNVRVNDILQVLSALVHEPQYQYFFHSKISSTIDTSATRSSQRVINATVIGHSFGGSTAFDLLARVHVTHKVFTPENASLPTSSASASSSSTSSWSSSSVIKFTSAITLDPNLRLVSCSPHLSRVASKTDYHLRLLSICAANPPDSQIYYLTNNFNIFSTENRDDSQNLHGLFNRNTCVFTTTHQNDQKQQCSFPNSVSTTSPCDFLVTHDPQMDHNQFTDVFLLVPFWLRPLIDYFVMRNRIRPCASAHLSTNLTNSHSTLYIPHPQCTSSVDSTFSSQEAMQYIIRLILDFLSGNCVINGGYFRDSPQITNPGRAPVQSACTQNCPPCDLPVVRPVFHFHRDPS